MSTISVRAGVFATPCGSAFLDRLVLQPRCVSDSDVADICRLMAVESISVAKLLQNIKIPSIPFSIEDEYILMEKIREVLHANAQLPTIESTKPRLRSATKGCRRGDTNLCRPRRSDTVISETTDVASAFSRPF